jgi:hypothetical protein
VNVGPLIFVLEYIKPVFQAINILLLLVSGVVAARAGRTPGLLLLCIACFLSALNVAMYFTFDIQLQWKITVLPVSVRQVAFFLSHLLYPIEIFLWPIAVILVAREHRASSTRTI